MGWSEQDEQDEHRLLVERVKPRDDRIEELERQLAEARAELDAEGREWLRTKDIDRLQEAEHQLAEARAEIERLRGERRESRKSRP